MSSFCVARRFKIAFLSVCLVAGAGSILRTSSVSGKYPFALQLLQLNTIETNITIIDNPRRIAESEFNLDVDVNPDNSTRPPLKTDRQVTAGANLPFVNCHWNFRSITTAITTAIVDGAVLQLLLMTMMG
eukprot:jgi/Psemu1/307804/fgenesh1_kg.354_\